MPEKPVRAGDSDGHPGDCDQELNRVTVDELRDSAGGHWHSEDDLSGDAGVAVLAETDYFGCDFVDYVTVARMDGRWWITNKTYAHTSGSPPARLTAAFRP